MTSVSLPTPQVWETWALLLILGLCFAVIGWAVWGFYRDTRSGRDARFLRLSLLGTGGYLEVVAAGGVGRWHRGQHRAVQGRSAEGPGRWRSWGNAMADNDARSWDR